MNTDGGLRPLFRKHCTEAQWTSIESRTTGQGIPDMEYCFPPDGAQGWVENKKTNGNVVKVAPFQVAWHERRARMGGRSFIAVRVMQAAGQRRGPAIDALVLVAGATARALMVGGLAQLPPSILLGRWQGGPARWDWAKVTEILRGC